MNEFRKLLESTLGATVAEDEDFGSDQASATLQAVKAESDKRVAAYRERGFRIGDAPEVHAMAPNMEYPAPWSASGRPSEPWSIIASNGKTVATWLTQEQAKAAVAEVQGGVEEARIQEDEYENETEQDEALQELQDIHEQLGELSSRARDLMRSYFKTEYRQGEAYGAFDFGSSGNPYDTTFEKILEDLLSDRYN